ncbi:MAG: iron export ABC transporter permease subunit FetB [Candidatus Binatia bacterium]
MSTHLIDPTWFQLASALALILVAIGLSAARGLGLERDLAVAAARTFVQLLAIGYVLGYVFSTHSPLLIVGILLLMLLIAAWTVAARQRRPTRTLRLLVLGSLGTGCGLTLVLGTQLILRITPWYNPYYLIPLMGMVIGNSLNSATLAVERLDSDLRSGRDQVEALLALGATSRQAAAAAMRNAMKAAMLPIVNSMMVVGLVSLPGMMTGQILGGNAPLIAIKYQVLIMYMIAFSTAVTAFVLTTLRARSYFTAAHQLREEAVTG